MTEPRSRPALNLGTDDENDDLDLSAFGVDNDKETPRVAQTEPTASEVRSISEAAGFPSRSAEAKSPRRRKRVLSPYKDQVGIKCRPGMKELFQDIGDELGTLDYTTFERALQALLRELDDHDLQSRFRRLTTDRTSK